MKILSLVQITLMSAALVTSASAAQPYGAQPDQRAERRDISRDMRQREQLARQVEQDRRDVEHERQELRRANWFNAGRESRELRRAKDRLNRDTAALRALDQHLAYDLKRVQ